jgi:assimilatory nitrate reductase catalytic subunit
MIPLEKQNWKCVCLNIPYADIQYIIEKHNCKNYKELQKHCPAGTCCGSCVGDIQDMCDEESSHE